MVYLDDMNSTEKGVADPRDDFTSLNPAISQVYRSIHPLNQQRPEKACLAWAIHDVPINMFNKRSNDRLVESAQIKKMMKSISVVEQSIGSIFATLSGVSQLGATKNTEPIGKPSLTLAAEDFPSLKLKDDRRLIYKPLTFEAVWGH